MNIIKIVGVFIKDRKYLVSRDTDEDFFKNVGGKPKENESEEDCLKRELLDNLKYKVTKKPEIIFSLPPTPALGDKGKFVVLHFYLVSKEENILLSPSQNTAELAWVNTKNKGNYKLTPQISDLVIPKLHDLGFID